MRVAIYRVWADMIAIGSEPHGLISLTKTSHHSLLYNNILTMGQPPKLKLIILTFITINIISIIPRDTLQIP